MRLQQPGTATHHACVSWFSVASFQAWRLWPAHRVAAAVLLADLAQMVFVEHHEVGATTLVWARDAVACVECLQQPGYSHPVRLRVMVGVQ